MPSIWKISSHASNLATFFQSNEFHYYSDKKTVEMEILWKVGFPKIESGSCMKAYAGSGNWANEKCDNSSSYIICESV